MTQSLLFSQKMRGSAENYQSVPGSSPSLPVPLGQVFERYWDIRMWFLQFLQAYTQPQASHCTQPGLWAVSVLLAFLEILHIFTFFSYLDKETLSTQREDMDNLRPDVLATENSGDHRSNIVQNERRRAGGGQPRILPSSFALTFLPLPVLLRGHSRIHLL